MTHRADAAAASAPSFFAGRRAISRIKPGQMRLATWREGHRGPSTRTREATRRGPSRPLRTTVRRQSTAPHEPRADRSGAIATPPRPEGLPPQLWWLFAVDACITWQVIHANWRAEGGAGVFTHHRLNVRAAIFRGRPDRDHTVAGRRSRDAAILEV